MIRPIAEVIKYNPTREVVAAEWTAAKIAPKADAKPAVKFGKKAAR